MSNRPTSILLLGILSGAGLALLVQALPRLTPAAVDQVEGHALANRLSDLDASAAIDRIAAESSTLNAEGLQLAALIQRAEQDPIGALRAVTDLPRAVHELAVAEIGRIAASNNPAAAAAAESIVPLSLRMAYLREVFAQWALVDPAQFLDHLRTLDADRLAPLLDGALVRPDDLELMAMRMRIGGMESPVRQALMLAAASDPMRVLDFGREIGGQLGIVAEAAGLEALAVADPDTATAYVAALPIGFRRESLTTSTARGFARHDTDAALAWVTTLSPPNPQAESAVMTEIASIDLARAVRIEVADLDTRQGAVVNSADIPIWFADSTIGELNDAVGILDSIIGAGENGFWEENMLNTTLRRWSRADPGGAIAWMLGNREHVPADALEAVAEAFGAADVEQKLSLADMLEPARRSDWIGNALQAEAMENPNNAMAIAARYRAEPYYDNLVMGVAMVVASSQSPEAAARLLDSSPPRAAAAIIGRRWAEQDPVQAAVWVGGLQDREARASGVTEVLATWARSDVNAARQWAQGLGDAELRAQALAAICRAMPEAAGCG